MVCASPPHQHPREENSLWNSPVCKVLINNVINQTVRQQQLLLLLLPPVGSGKPD